MVEHSRINFDEARSADPASFARPLLDNLDGPSARTHETLRVLLVASRFKLPYSVLRCARAAGAEVFVLGSRSARKLKYSNHCKAFIRTHRELDGGGDLELAKEINALIGALNIDMVLPGDAPTTRALIQLRALIRAQCFPMPTLAQFDELNNKWRFGLLCASLNIPYPRSRLFTNVEALRVELNRNQIDAPFMVKPLSMDGGIGCIKLQPGNLEAQLSEITYGPILFQEYIEGEDIGASVFCLRGKIINFIAHKYEKDAYYSFFDQNIFNDIKTIMDTIQADGVFNFDMRRASDGSIVYLECNPRFYFKIAMSMIVGMNFVAAALKSKMERSVLETNIPKIARFPKAFLLALASFKKLEPESWEALRFVCSDPIPYILETLGRQE